MGITSRANKEYLTSLCIGAAIGLPWLAGTIGIALSPLLIPVVARGSNAANRRLRAFGYFLAGSAGLPDGAATFFGPGHIILGYLLWLASAALLALPWAWATNGWRTLGAIAASALPPLGIIGWLSPLTAAGLWFPGLGWMGLGLVMLGLWLLGERKPKWIVPLGAISLIANLGYTAPKPPGGWVGVNTHVGPQPKQFLDQYQRFNTWTRQVRKQSQSAKVVVLPEGIAPDWWDGTRGQIAQAVPPGQTWLVGASVKDDEGQLWDAITVVRHGMPDQAPLFKAVLPVPVSMWKPWAGDGYTATWWQPARMIEGMRTMAVICYDQLLVWPWLEALVQKPDVIIAPSNGWWADKGSIPVIQAASSTAWGRLMGMGVIRGVNR